MDLYSMNTSPRYVILDDDIFALVIATNIVRNHSRRAEVVSFSSCKKAKKIWGSIQNPSLLKGSIELTGFRQSIQANGFDR
jgi:hypothetical protein